MKIYKKAYGKMMSKYRERVASAKTAGDFAAIWLIMFSLIIACGITTAIFEWFSDLLTNIKWFPEDHADIWKHWDEIPFFFIIAYLLFLVLYFKDADIRFWDPRVHWLKGYCGKIDIERIRKMHTDFPCPLAAEGTAILLLLYITYVLATIVIELLFWLI